MRLQQVGRITLRRIRHKNRRAQLVPHSLEVCWGEREAILADDANARRVAFLVAGARLELATFDL